MWPWCGLAIAIAAPPTDFGTGAGPIRENLPFRGETRAAQMESARATASGRRKVAQLGQSNPVLGATPPDQAKCEKSAGNLTKASTLGGRHASGEIKIK